MTSAARYGMVKLGGAEIVMFSIKDPQIKPYRCFLMRLCFRIQLASNFE